MMSWAWFFSAILAFTLICAAYVVYKLEDENRKLRSRIGDLRRKLKIEREKNTINERVLLDEIRQRRQAEEHLKARDQIIDELRWGTQYQVKRDEPREDA